MDIYATAKDFAGPLATVLAASAAVCVTFYFNQRQHELSAAQRDIALDKLKFDAFGKRYEIYSQAKELLEYVIQLRDFEKIDSSKIRELRVKIDEARFFFGPTVRAFLADIDSEAEALLVNLGRRYSWEAESDDDLWRSIGNELAQNSSKLSQYYSQMPARFQPSMQLSQLARE